LRRPYRLPVAWHAVARGGSVPLALCGFRYTREVHRTWKQTIISRRCRKCQALAEQAELTVSTSPLWAIPGTPEVGEELTGIALTPPAMGWSRRPEGVHRSLGDTTRAR
jgi:hypothetical protein